MKLFVFLKSFTHPASPTIVSELRKVRVLSLSSRTWSGRRSSCLTAMTCVNICKDVGRIDHDQPLICSAALSCITSDYLLLLLPAALCNRRRRFWKHDCNYTQETRRHSTAGSGRRRIRLHFTGRIMNRGLAVCCLKMFEYVYWKQLVRSWSVNHSKSLRDRWWY